MSYTLAIYYFLQAEFRRDSTKWFGVREVANKIDLSIERTRKHLNLLRLGGEVETKISGWSNVYRFKG